MRFGRLKHPLLLKTFYLTSLSLLLASCGGDGQSNASNIAAEKNRVKSEEIVDTTVVNDANKEEVTELNTLLVLTNLAENGDLETGSTVGWSAEGDSTQIDLSIDEKFEGDYALVAHGPDSGEREVSFDLSNFNFDTSKHYEFSLSLKSSNPAKTRISFQSEINGTLLERNASIIETSDEWVTEEFIIPADSTYLLHANKILISASNSNSLLIDSLNILEITNASIESGELLSNQRITSAVPPKQLSFEYVIIIDGEMIQFCFDDDFKIIDCYTGLPKQAGIIQPKSNNQNIEAPTLRTYIHSTHVDGVLYDQTCYNESRDEINCNTLSSASKLLEMNYIQKDESELLEDISGQRFFSGSQCPILAYKVIGGTKVIPIYPPTHPACPP